ncbi:MAG: hypothetical protein GXY76_06580 [Chloroflexi bacterium]|nr:hypothetical protein [Chloroflexota bacterium]
MNHREVRKVFLVHWIMAGILGLVLWVIPGRFLQALGWAPIDPILSRLLGAALLALGWASFLGWRAKAGACTGALIQMELVYTVLGAVAVLRHLLVAHWPWMVWLLFVVLAGWAVAWAWCALWGMRRQGDAPTSA